MNITCHEPTQFWPHLRPHQQQLNIINHCKKNQKYWVLIYSKQCTLFIMSNVTWHICPRFVQRFVKTWGRIGDLVALGVDRLFPNRIPRARRSLANFQKDRTKIIAQAPYFETRLVQLLFQLLFSDVRLELWVRNVVGDVFVRCILLSLRTVCNVCEASVT